MASCCHSFENRGGEEPRGEEREYQFAHHVSSGVPPPPRPDFRQPTAAKLKPRYLIIMPRTRRQEREKREQRREGGNEKKAPLALLSVDQVRCCSACATDELLTSTCTNPLSSFSPWLCSCFEVMNSQLKHPALEQPLVHYAGLGLMAFGGLLVLTSSFKLGWRNVFMGEAATVVGG